MCTRLIAVAAVAQCLPLFAGGPKFAPPIAPYFEENRGQSDPSARFLSRGSGYSVFITDRGAVLSLPGKEGKQSAALRMTLSGGQASTAKGEGQHDI